MKKKDIRLIVGIINYGLGNTGSIYNILQKIGVEVAICNDVKSLYQVDKLILPGVGAFDKGMENLKERGYIDALNNRVIEQKIPILGICLGYQMMTRKSEEGCLPGLGWFDADTIRFRFTDLIKLKVPHMGWNTVEPLENSVLFREMHENARFYFVHSYFIKPDRVEDVLCKTNYGEWFASGMSKHNIFGVQFHPEKSHKFGMKLLENFAAMEL